MRTIIIIGLLLSTGVADAIECQSSRAPSNKGHWAWRLIDNKKCWYAGDPGMDKSKLHWPTNPDWASESAQRTGTEPAKSTTVQRALRTEATRSDEARARSTFEIPARAGGIDRADRRPGINRQSSAVSIPAGGNAARTESHAFQQPVGDDSRRADLAVSWPALTTRPVSDMRGFGTLSSSHTKNRAATEAPQPMQARAGAAERKRAAAEEFRSQAAFSLTVFSGALAIALLLSCAILKLASQANTQDPWRTAPAWLQAFRQRRTSLAQKAGRRSELRKPGNSVAKKPPSMPADDLESGLRDLIRDLRRTEVAGEEPQTSASTARSGGPRRSYLRVMNVGEAPAMGAHEYHQRSSRLSKPFVPLRSAVA
jgi:hypothetical protein